MMEEGILTVCLVLVLLSDVLKGNVRVAFQKQRNQLLLILGIQITVLVVAGGDFQGIQSVEVKAGRCEYPDVLDFRCRQGIEHGIGSTHMQVTLTEGVVGTAVVENNQQGGTAVGENEDFRILEIVCGKENEGKHCIQ